MIDFMTNAHAKYNRTHPILFLTETNMNTNMLRIHRNYKDLQIIIGFSILYPHRGIDEKVPVCGRTGFKGITMQSLIFPMNADNEFQTQFSK